MRQGSILAFLQPRTVSIAPKSQPSEEQASVLQVIDSISAAPCTSNQEKDEATLTLNGPEPVSTAIVSVNQQVTLRDPRAAITKVFPSHLDRLKSITSTLLSVRYSDRFFTECLELDSQSVISYAAIFDSKPVGWIRCRVEPSPNHDNPAFHQVYIQALGILAPFRGIGLASALLDAVISVSGNCQSIYAHVWETSEDALAWYDKHGFGRVMLVPQYYRKLRPSGAWIVRKELACR